MINNYINALTLDLIEKLDYMPVMESSGNYNLNSFFRLLERASIGDYSLVFVIDGDIHTPEVLGMIIGRYIERMDYINITGVSETISLSSVVVFSDKPEESKLAALNEICTRAQNKGKLFELVIVGLNQKQVTEYTDYRIYSHGLKSAIQDRLYSDLSPFDSLPDINELINRESPEPTLEMAANKAPATYVILGINIAIWLLDLSLYLLFGQNYIAEYGVKYAPDIIQGEYWRLVTPIFLHADMAHLAGNSFSLLIFGQVIERIFGTKKFLIIYFVSGILGNIASFAFANPYSASLGASGAIMGVGGAFILIWLENRRAFAGDARQYLTLVFAVFFNIFYGFTNVGIDNLAHLGGLLGGFLISSALYKDNANDRQLYAGTVIALMVIGIIIGFR